MPQWACCESRSSSGAPEIIERLVADIPGAQNGFALYFSEAPFPRHQAELIWVREEYGGNWYRLNGTDLEGWLCPALFKYFSTAPPRIYCRAEAAKLLTPDTTIYIVLAQPAVPILPHEVIVVQVRIGAVNAIDLFDLPGR